MRDDADQSVASGQLIEGAYRMFQRIIVQRTETLIHEERIQLDASRGGLDLVRHAQCQGERGHEGFPAGERIGIAGRAVVMVDHVQVQAELALFVVRRLPSFELILSGGHFQ